MEKEKHKRSLTPNKQRIPIHHILFTLGLSLALVFIIMALINPSLRLIDPVRRGLPIAFYGDWYFLNLPIIVLSVIGLIRYGMRLRQYSMSILLTILIVCLSLFWGTLFLNSFLKYESYHHNCIHQGYYDTKQISCFSLESIGINIGCSPYATDYTSFLPPLTLLNYSNENTYFNDLSYRPLLNTIPIGIRVDYARTFICF